MLQLTRAACDRRARAAFGGGGGAFGAKPATPAFGATPAPATGFGAPATAGGFGTPAAGGFGAAGGATPGGAFGQAAQPAGGAFGASGSPGAFGQPATAGAFGATGERRAAGATARCAQPRHKPEGNPNTDCAALRASCATTARRGCPAPAGGAFGSVATPGAFGSAPAGGGFGSAPATGAFGAAPAGGAFGQPSPAASASPFGTTAAQPAGAFGAAAASPGGAFGAAAPAAGGAFGAPGAAASPFGSSPSAGGAFGAAGGAFGAAAGTAGTRNPPYVVTSEADSSAQGGKLNYQSISAMPAYKGKCVEELRFEDYQRNDKGGASGVASPGGAFGAQPAAPGAFGTTPGGAFGAPAAASPGFGAQPAATGAFGAPATGGAFGAPAASTPGFGGFGTAASTAATPAFGQAQPAASAFGAATPTTTAGAGAGGLFGAQTPAAGSAFGAATATPAASGAFGATTPAFGAQPAGASPAFGAAATPAATTPAFGGFGTASQPAATPGGTGLFGASATTPAFGAAAPTSTPFGAAATPTPVGAAPAFGAATTAASPGLGGLGATSSPFPATSAAPATGGLFGAAAPAAGGGLFGSTTTPAAPSAFGATTPTPALGGGLFGAQKPATPASGGLFGAPAATAAATTPITGAGTTSLFGGPVGPAIGGPVGPPALPPLNTLQPIATTPGLTPTTGALSLAQPGSPYPATPVVPTLGAAGAPAGKVPTPGTVSSLVPGGYMGQSPAVVFAPRRVTPLSQMKVRVRKNQQSPAAAAAQAAAATLSEADGGMFSAQPLGPAYAKPAARDNPRALFIRKTDKKQQLEAVASPMPAGTLALPAPGEAEQANGGTPTTISIVRAGRRVGDEPAARDETPQPAHARNGENGAADDAPPSVPKLGCDGKHDDYEMWPSAQELATAARESADALKHVEGFTVSRSKFGSVKWIGETNVNGLDLDKIIRFYPAGVEVYKDADGKALADKPARGSGLNRPAIVTLCNVHPKSGPVLSARKLEKWVERLKEQCTKMGATFRGYDAEIDGGTWSFRVEHFSTYGLDEDFFAMDDEDDETGEPGMAEDDEIDAVLVKRPGEEGEVTLGMPSMDVDSEDDPVEEDPPVPTAPLPPPSAGALPAEIGRAHGFDPERASELHDALFLTDGAVAQDVYGQSPPSVPPPAKKSRPEPAVPITASAAATAAAAPARRAAAPFSAPNSSDLFVAGGAVDAALLLGKSTRVGWGPGLAFVHACPRSASDVAALANEARLKGEEPPVSAPRERVNAQIRTERVVVDSAIARGAPGARASLLASDAVATQTSSRVLRARYEELLKVAWENCSIDEAEGEASSGTQTGPRWKQCPPAAGLSQLCDEYEAAVERESEVCTGAGGPRQEVMQERSDEWKAHAQTWHLIRTLFARLPGGLGADGGDDMDGGEDASRPPMASASSWGPYEAARRRALLSEWFACHTRENADIDADSEGTAAAMAGIEALVAAAKVCETSAAPVLVAALVRANAKFATTSALLDASKNDADALRAAAVAAAYELAGDDADPDGAADALLQACRSDSAVNAAEAAPRLRAVLHMLSGNQVSRATEASAQLGDVRLASLIASVGCGRASREWLQVQVERWEEAGFFNAPGRFHPERVRLYRLLAGDIRGAAAGAIKDDWKRAVGLRLWFGAGAGATGSETCMADALAEYAEAERDKCASAPPPLPAYAERRAAAGMPAACMHEDLAYHLLQLGCAGTSYEAGTAGDPQSGNALGRMLCPEGHVANALDHRLSWAALCTLTACGALPAAVGQSSAAAAVHAAFASQLEVLGLPHWAAFVALHTPPSLGHGRGESACPPAAREACVREMLGRTAPLWVADPALEQALHTVAHVPLEWVQAARAQLEAYRGSAPRLAVASAAQIEARAQGEAHATLLRRVAAPLLLAGADGVKRLEELLELLGQSEAMIARWGDGGGALVAALEAARALAAVSQNGGDELDRLTEAAMAACERLTNAAKLWRDAPPRDAPVPAALATATGELPGELPAATLAAALAALAEELVSALYTREGNTARAHAAALAAPLAPERREVHVMHAASAFLEMRA